MSTRLRERFQQGKAEGRSLFVAYVTAGYPTRADTVPILLEMQAGGADVIELGVPFTDPLADGATIQHANQVAIGQHVTLLDCFGFIREARARGLTVPVLFMGYYNPILAIGEARAAAEGAASGIDGFIVVDLPPDEAGSFLVECRARDLSFVPLVAPTTSDARIPLLAKAADAFLYIVSVTGTTGATSVAVDELPALLARVRAQTDLPLGVGFGISRREHVVAVGKVAEAAIVGSAIISAIDAAGAESPARRVREYVEHVTGR